MTVRRHPSDALDFPAEHIFEHEECAWCGNPEPWDYAGVGWLVFNFTQDSELAPYRYCSPLHLSYAMQTISDEYTGPPETLDDLEALVRIKEET